MTIKTDIQDTIADIQANIDVLNSQVDLIDVAPPAVLPLELRSPSCPTSVAVNYYPYEIHYHEGFLYVSTQGGGNVGGPGNALFQKVNPKTGVIVSSYNAGAYASGNGLKGFCIHDGYAYVVNNKYNVPATELLKIDLSSMSLVSTISLGAGGARNCVTDGTYIYACTTNLKMKKVNIATQAVTDVYTFGANTDPFRTAYFAGKLWVCLFGASGNSVDVMQTDGTFVQNIFTGAGSQPNWFGQTDSKLFVSCYGTHKVYEISGGSLGTTFTCPAADYPHVPFPVMDKQLWLGGTTAPTSYIRVFDIDTGALITSLAKGPNIPNMAFDGGNVWNISANGNYIQRTVLDLVNE